MIIATLPQAPAGATAGTTAPVPVNGVPGFPGMVVSSDTLISGADGSANLYSARPCAEVTTMLGSGEWTLTTRATFSNSLNTGEAGLLQRGSARALTLVQGNSDGCGAHIEALSTQPIKTEGKVSLSAEGLAYPLSCIEGEDSVGVGIAYSTVNNHMVTLMFNAPKQGTRTLSKQDPSVSVKIDPMKGGLTRFLIASFGGVSASDTSASDTSAKSKPSADEFQPGADFTGTVAITSSKPFAGQVTIKGLVDENGQTETIAAGFQCNHIENPKRINVSPAPQNSTAQVAFPADFPVPSGAADQKFLPTSGLITVHAAGGIADVAAFYKAALPKYGWTVSKFSLTAGALATIEASKNGRTLSVNVLKDKNTGQTKVIAFYPNR